MDVIDKIQEHYKNNKDVLAKKAGRILKDHAYGEDCTQEAYEACLKYKDSFSVDKGDFDKWFNRIFWRTVGKYQGFVKGSGEIEPIQIWEIDPVIAVEYVAETNLSDKYKHILSLIYGKGYTPKAIAELDPTISTAVCYRAVHLFKQEVKDKYALYSGRRG